MAGKEKNDEPRRRVSKTKLLLGAAGVFLFIVGVKRSLRPGEPLPVAEDPPAELEGAEDGG
jgi:hypothetical protein